MINQAIRPQFIFAALALIGLLSVTADAASRSWDAGGGADTDWTTDANWSSNVEPVASDTAEFDRGALVPNYTVTFPLLPLGVDETTDRLIVGSNAVTFANDRSNTNYLVTATATGELSRGVMIGEEANDTAAALTSHLGLLSTAAATLGHVAGSSGTLTLNQNGDRFNITGSHASDTELIIGRYGTGTLSVSGGADVNLTGIGGNSIIGEYTGSTGAATVFGTGSTWTSTIELYVGYQGAATLNILAGGKVNNGRGYVGTLAGSIASATVDGAGSAWTNSAELYIGDAGNGTLDITGGGQVTSKIGYIGNQSGSTGEATVSGTGSTWTTSGNMYVGNQGDGTLTIENSGAVDVAGNLSINNVSAVNLHGGVLKVGSLSAVANLNWTGGSLHLTSSNLILDSGSTLGSSLTVAPMSTLILGFGAHYIGQSGAGALTVNGGTANSPVEFIIGELDGSDGTIQVNGGGKLTTGGAEIGRRSGAVGAATVDGMGSMWTTKELLVGRGGYGTLSVSRGGHLFSTSSTWIGFDSGSKGQVTVEGAGSSWTTAIALSVAHFGTGSLEITGGGQVNRSEDSSITYVGYGVGSNGQVMVDGIDSSWTVSDHLYIGDAGRGELIITDGGRVESNDTVFTVLGNLSGSTGNVTVHGVGAIWTSAINNIYVGRNGNGTVAITGGAQITCNSGRFGSGTGSSGTVTIDGTASKWTSAFLVVGGDDDGNATNNGTASLALTNGGTMESDVSVFIRGEIHGDGNIVGNVVNDGEIHGELAIVGNVQNGGLVSPGMSTGALDIDGNYTQTSAGQLSIELESNSSYDRLVASGNIALAGTLHVRLCRKPRSVTES